MIPDYKKKLQRLKPWKRRLLFFALGALIMALCLPLAAYGVYRFSYRGLIYPGVLAAGVSLGGLTQDEAEARIEFAIQRYAGAVFPFTLEAEESQWTVPYDPNMITFNADETAHRAFLEGRNVPFPEQIARQVHLLAKGRDLPIDIQIDEGFMKSLNASMAAQLQVEPVMAEIELLEKAAGLKEVVITPGKGGKQVNIDQLKKEWQLRMSHLLPPSSTIPITFLSPPASDEMMAKTKQRGESLIDKKLNLTWNVDDKEEMVELTDVDLVDFLAFDGQYNTKLINGLLERLAVKIERKPQNAKFQFDEPNHRVTEFLPAIEGVALDIPTSKTMIAKSISKLELGEVAETTVLTLTTTLPEIRLDTVNDLGISELIGSGFSTYKGSIAGRVHNVALAAERINGTLIRPGESFSFNQAVGEVSGVTGYQKAYIIINGRTELDDGGGVCQVSTTVFRAALNAGLPITERRAHAYRVGYYEQNAKAGLDATVYSPTTDLKFTNDSPHHILVQTMVDAPNRALTINFYGTKDGRSSEITNHEVWAIVPPPPDIYQDDPSLPSGTIKQVEHKVAGAKAKFDYTVRRDGEVIYEKTFYSVFKPWAAIFLRGTGQ
jgi:vancomycin resistance protein YoaR